MKNSDFQKASKCDILSEALKCFLGQQEQILVRCMMHDVFIETYINQVKSKSNFPVLDINCYWYERIFKFRLKFEGIDKWKMYETSKLILQWSSQVLCLCRLAIQILEKQVAVLKNQILFCCKIARSFPLKILVPCRSNSSVKRPWCFMFRTQNVRYILSGIQIVLSSI
jgi:hypothetical protein